MLGTDLLCEMKSILHMTTYLTLGTFFFILELLLKMQRQYSPWLQFEENYSITTLPGKSHGWRSLVGWSTWVREQSDTTERLHFHFHTLEKEMATHSSVLAWRIPGTAEPGGQPSLGSHRVGHDWSDLGAAEYNHSIGKRALTNTSFDGQVKFDRSSRKVMFVAKIPNHIQKWALLTLPTHHLS